MAEANLRAAVAALEAGRAQLEALGRQEELLRLSLEEYVRARETMLRFKDAGEGAEILVPIGANSFLFGTIRDTERCMVGIGGEVVLEDSIGKAVARLDNRIKQMGDVQGTLAERMEELDEKVQQYSAVVQAEYEKLQRGQGRSQAAP